ncbi:reticulocyte binding protein 1b [Plasmodium brasilianum]|uniref:Reticulocyte binding protein 1b n=1 Tax=Plasmodium brasilianum TaxID=5824 RepID=A0ACB9YC34_PLABR|nr:reticulocyte binding protein 1b [Plasmodium brasilianum]
MDKGVSGKITTDDKTLIEFQLKKIEYNNYVKEYSNNIKDRLYEIKKQEYENLKKSHCTHQCNEYVLNYVRLLNKYIKDTKSIKNESYTAIPKSIRDYSVLDNLLEHANKGNIDINEIIYPLKLIGEEIEDIDFVYVINRSFIDDAVSILNIKKEKSEIFNTREENIVIYSKELTNNYAVFQKLKDKAYSLINSSYVDTEIKNICKESEEIVKYVKETLERNRKKLDFFSKYPSIKTHNIIKYLEEDYLMLDEYKKDLKFYFEFISNKYKKIYVIQKLGHLKELRDIMNKKTDTLEASLLLDEITKINYEEKEIDKSLITIRNFYEIILNIRKQFNDLNIDIEKNVSNVVLLMEDELHIIKNTK